jgi:hypothetical protein
MPLQSKYTSRGAELRRAGDVSPLMLREANNQGIHIPRSPKSHLNFDRLQDNSRRCPGANHSRTSIRQMFQLQYWQHDTDAILMVFDRLLGTLIPQEKFLK